MYLFAHARRLTTVNLVPKVYSAFKMAAEVESGVDPGNEVASYPASSFLWPAVGNARIVLTFRQASKRSKERRLEVRDWATSSPGFPFVMHWKIGNPGQVQRHSCFEWLCKHNRLRPGGRFSKAPETFRARKAIAKSWTLRLHSRFIHIFLIWRRVLFIHEVSCVYTSPFPDKDERKIALRARKVSGAFEKQAPEPFSSPEPRSFWPVARDRGLWGREWYRVRPVDRLILRGTSGQPLSRPQSADKVLFVSTCKFFGGG